VVTIVQLKNTNKSHKINRKNRNDENGFKFFVFEVKPNKKSEVKIPKKRQNHHTKQKQYCLKCWLPN
jgi:hypothetical protein